jgi:hypothetical protein
LDHGDNAKPDNLMTCAHFDAKPDYPKRLLLIDGSNVTVDKSPFDVSVAAAIAYF